MVRLPEVEPYSYRRTHRQIVLDLVGTRKNVVRQGNERLSLGKTNLNFDCFEGGTEKSTYPAKTRLWLFPMRNLPGFEPD